MPARIQRCRNEGWRLAKATSNPNGARIVDRTSRYGNPFRIGVDADDAAHATALYQEWLETNSPTVYNPYADAAYLDAMNARRDWILTHVHELAGKDVACFCDLPQDGEEDTCHGAFLIGLGNQLLLNGQFGTRLTESLTTKQRDAAVDAYVLIQSVEGQHVARAWMIGMNPHLNDLSPILAIQGGHGRDVLVAARVYLGGVYA